MRISKDPETRRQEILDNASELFAARGIDKTSISDIARSVGVAKGLVYYYFDSKENLVSSIITRFAAGVDQVLQEIVDQPGIGFYAKLSAVVSYYFQAIPAHRTIYSLTPGNPGVLTTIRDQLSTVALKHSGRLIEQGLAENLLHIAYPAYMLRIMIRGLGDLYVDGITDPQVHVELIEQMLGIEKGQLNLASEG